ncbi:CDGSH iron-sulfur domain-containing protein [Sulfurimonas sp. MAG313]|nr:CDGSH iron-sulfur domain-containing protein [Sulfurimonas sp. MAG313]MDF1880047.1 CDGSH iron-sulfur domain-containing protein [Sulfurimonas sp. MAG313]
MKDGPYEVEGIDLDGFESPTNFCPSKYTLCRCVFSKNKPYCDYSHSYHNWKD